MDVSVVIPCRNEEAFIERCLRSVEESREPNSEMEILVVDGMSDDGTRPILERLNKEYGNIRIIDNHQRRTPVALNLGVRNSTGRYVMRMDAHAEVQPDYVLRCLQAIESCEADNVGGSIRTVARSQGLMAQAIVQCLSHRFGVGNSHFRTGSTERRFVDTVFCGFYRREVFERIGRFNEQLARGQDIEFNLRLRQAGGKTLMLPEVVSTYYARSDYGSFLRHNFTNGEWVVLAFLRSEVQPVRPRHLVPMAFVASLLGCTALSWFAPFAWLGLAIGGAYLIAVSVAAASVARQQRDIRLFPAMLATFGGLHFSYGLGSLWGGAQVLKERISGWFRNCDNQ